MRHEKNLTKIGILTVAIVGFTALYMSSSYFVSAENTTNEVAVNNASSTIDAVSLNTSSVYNAIHLSSIDLTENTTTTYYGHVQFTDLNGCGDVIDGTPFEVGGLLPSQNGHGAVILHTSSTSVACDGFGVISDPKNCYRGVTTQGQANTMGQFGFSECSHTCTDPTAIQATVTCPLDVHHFTESGEWDVYGSIQDVPANPVGLVVTTSINILTALDINTTSVAYGSVVTGATSSEQSLTITNTGNDTVDFNLSSTDLACDAVGSIPATAQQVSTTLGFAYGTGVSVTSSASQFNLNLSKQTTSSTPSTDLVYWQLLVPSGVSGTCSSTATLTAVSG